MRCMIKSFLALLCWTHLLSIANASPESFVQRDGPYCPLDAISCSSRRGSPCCTPTNGVIVLTQQWLTELGPKNSFTIRGLWPNPCFRGQTPEEGCDLKRRYKDMDDILQRNQTLYHNMVEYWPSKNGSARNGEFWSQEWNKHGTCVSTLDPTCYAGYHQYQDVYDYFGTAVQLARQYDLYSILSDANITPGNTYPVKKIESTIEAKLGVIPEVTCDGSRLEDIRIYFQVKNGNNYVRGNASKSSACGDNVFYPTKQQRHRQGDN